jgi:ectoine hydroxylase-related dioxygenase (phytanoyl-CoA dioxygenase family)
VTHNTDQSRAASRSGVTLMREVEDEEVSFYREHGWVKLDRLIAPELAAQMREAVADRVLSADAAAVEGHVANSQLVHDRADRRDWHFVARDHGLEPFRSLAYAREIGRNAQRFVGRKVPINYHADLLAVKMPEGHLASGPTGFHQDWVNFPFDRGGFLTFWIALDEIPPERGSMRFLSRSHEAGPLGRMGLVSGLQVTEYYPDLTRRYEMSPPLHLHAGDATVHNGLVVHGAPPNTTDRPRWAYILSYHPADTCYTGAPHHIFSPDLGLEVGKPIKHDRFRVVYP